MRFESKQRGNVKVIQSFVGQYHVVEEVGHVVEIVAGPFETEREAVELLKLREDSFVSYPEEWRKAV